MHADRLESKNYKSKHNTDVLVKMRSRKQVYIGRQTD